MGRGETARVTAMFLLIVVVLELGAYACRVIKSLCREPTRGTHVVTCTRVSVYYSDNFRSTIETFNRLLKCLIGSSSAPRYLTRASPVESYRINRECIHASK